MKKFFVVAALGMLMAVGCAQKEEVLSPVASQRVISFEAPIVSPTTKAIVNGTVYPEDYTFDVSAKWYAEAAAQDYTTWTNGSLYMDEVEVAKVDAPEGRIGWTSATPYFWPKDGSLSFQAYSPSGVTEAEIGATGVKFVGYVATLDSTQVDLMFSDRVLDQTSNANVGENLYGVQLTFSHALSAICFKAQTDIAYENTTICIKDIILSGVKGKGTFDQKLNDDNTAPAENVVPAWEIAGDAAAVTYADVIRKEDVALSTTPVTTNYADMLVMPQSFDDNDDAIFTINYTIASGENTAIPQSASFKLNELIYKIGETEQAKAFEPGKRYTFSITIGLEKIYFAPLVTDWADVTVSGGMTI